MNSNREEEDELAARHLRAALGRLFGLDGPHRIVLATGILASLRLLFASLGVKRLLMTDSEYYDHQHFPGVDVHIAPVSALTHAARNIKPDAVIMSHVSWGGVMLPIADAFASLRAVECRTLLIADCSHSLAAAPAPLDSIKADMGLSRPLLKFSGGSVDILRDVLH